MTTRIIVVLVLSIICLLSLLFYQEVAV
jgi:hypothetical protein